VPWELRSKGINPDLGFRGGMPLPNTSALSRGALEPQPPEDSIRGGETLATECRTISANRKNFEILHRRLERRDMLPGGSHQTLSRWDLLREHRTGRRLKCFFSNLGRLPGRSVVVLSRRPAHLLNAKKERWCLGAVAVSVRRRQRGTEVVAFSHSDVELRARDLKALATWIRRSDSDRCPNSRH